MSSTIKVQRALAALYLSSSSKYQDQLGVSRGMYISAVEALFTAFWVDGKPVHSPEVIRQVLASVIGRERVEQILKNSESGEVRELLRRNTQDVFEDGAFGIPWILAVNSAGQRQPFWGFDRLGLLAEFLGLPRPALLSESVPGNSGDVRQTERKWPAHL
jgi:2-hydroxychromene-2-carboxylate isomerase